MFRVPRPKFLYSIWILAVL